MSGPEIEVYMGKGSPLEAYVKMDGKKLDCIRKVEVAVEAGEPSEVRLTLCPVAVRVHGMPTQLTAYMHEDEPLPLPWAPGPDNSLGIHNISGGDE